MLYGEIEQEKDLTGTLETEIIQTGGGSSNIDTISVDGVKIEPDENKNVNIDLSGKASVEYVDDKFNGANKAVSFVNYSSMITSLNSLTNESYNVGQNIMIITLNVPDLWISEIAESSIAYTYVSDDDFINELVTSGSVQVGYYKLSALETQKVDLTEYVKNTDYATGSEAGIVAVDQSFASPYGGIFRSTLGNNRLIIRRAKFKDIDDRNPNNYIDGGANGINMCCPITPANFDYAFKQAFLQDKLKGYVYEGVDYSWTNEEKATVRSFLGIDNLSNQIDIDSTGDVTQELLPNVLYNFTDTDITSLTINFASAINNKVNEYMFQFIAGAGFTGLTLPEGVVWLGGTEPSFTEGKTYQVSVLNNLAIIGEF